MQINKYTLMWSGFPTNSGLVEGPPYSNASIVLSFATFFEFFSAAAGARLVNADFSSPIVVGFII